MFTREELLMAAATQPTGGLLPRRFAGGAVDSRQVQHGELFFALRGAQTDGHRFIGAAVLNGASAVVCAEPSQAARAHGVPQVVVQDPLDVLQRLARLHLRRHPETRVIAITGSNGKTSAKEATAQLLQHLGPTLKTLGNLNTETGLPLTLLRLNPEHRFAVLEMGAQWVGEIAMLCRIAPPEIAAVTVVGPEHLEYFGSMENVVKGESEAVASLPPHGVAILNDDDKLVRRMARRTKARVFTYGHRPNADVRAMRVGGDPLRGLSFTLSCGGDKARVRLHVPGEHAVTTALVAASVAICLGMNIQMAAAALGEILPVRRRGEIKRAFNGAPLVDDTYNANRQSAIAAVDLLRGAKIAGGARRWFVFGDMLELGSYSLDEHAAVGVAAAQGLDELVLIGNDVRATAQAAEEAGMAPDHIHLFAATLDNRAALDAARHAAATLVREGLQPEDLVLVKGSLGVGMDAIVRELIEHGETAPHNADEHDLRDTAPVHRRVEVNRPA